MTEHNLSEDDGEEDSSLLEGKKQNDNRICGTQARILLSGIGVLIMVTLGVLIGATLSSRSENKGSKTKESEVCMNSKIRLPGNVVPIKYRIFMHPNITDGTFDVSGNIKILVKIKKETDVLILHSKKLNILETILHVAESEDLEMTADFPVLAVSSVEECKRREQLIIKVGEVLPVDGMYVVHIKFAAKLSEGLEGFYKSTYTTRAGEKRYLATTHFEATGARSAFPCFDEPAMKAMFKIIMVRDKKHVALSNMPVEKTEARSQDGLVTDYFQESVKMSSYLVAFVVSDFSSLNKTSQGGIMVKVWAPTEQIGQAQFALDSAAKILDYYDDFFKVKFPLPKLDLIAIPDFGAGAMENWGLITYRLTSLLYDEKESSSSMKQWVAVVVAHELAHQWFGNLVTMKWWNDLWLNEGFAAFVEYIGADLINPKWQMMDQFVLDNVEKSLVLDSHLNSHAISVTVDDPAQINEIFDAISYDKGSSIIRMMQDFLGKDTFHKGLTDYLNKYKFGNAVSDDLWQCMSDANKIGNINVKGVMDTWTLQMGYPVINVVRDPGNKGVAVATQKHFITDVRTDDNKPKESIFNYTWDVPLTYHFENEVEERKWFYHKDESVEIAWKESSRWLKVNVEQIGFYRVNYDKENWDALSSQLNEDHTVLKSADRANILDDVFELARAGEIPLVQALNMTTYLPKEKEYVPYISALGSIGYIGGMLLQRPGYKVYTKYILQIVLPRVKELGWTDTGTHLDKYLRGAVLRSAVFHNDTDSVREAKTMFNDWMYDNKSIPANLRSTAYLAGLRYGGRKEWDYIFKKYNNSQFPSEKRKLMLSLGSTSDPNILQHYLDMALDEDVIRSQDSTTVIEQVAGNIKGTELALKFVKKNWDIIYKRYGHGSFSMSRLIKSVFGVSRTQEGLDDAKAFFETHKDKLGTGKLAAQQTLAAIQNHITWLQKNEESVVKWLKKAVLS